MTHCRAEVRRARVQVLRVRAPRAARARSAAGPAMPVYGDAPRARAGGRRSFAAAGAIDMIGTTGARRPPLGRADGLCGPRPR
ncbi:Uncharacterised protein [Burkholderia pseudomallei]|nr:hypothetical protein Y044_4669 [Burkholderia pseudomallei MSHR2243]AIV69065.1 hypothetical protein Y028_4151 [Burkholderia pseudomallei MSHR62]AJX74940.1 hypothetical protein BG16_4366 [Burkholderia pseudomallei MSHR2543]KGC93905.1 hypothetical protein DP62_3186 [Burkholderia pseudomallei]KGS95594.1 hypothetical protein X963_2857 [Burkholderia pseudomallei MSHR7498]KGU68371.1 hypothetical protein Y035_3469 [Burkholderia pseudomallei MSHR465J]KGV47291.1 hypothetical protein X900_4511 [Burkh